MDTTIIKFANVMTSNGDVTYLVDPVVSDIGGYRVSIKDTNFKNENMDIRIMEWFTDQYSIYKPIDIIIIHDKITYKYNLEHVVKHIKKMENSVSDLPCCSCGDDCDCAPIDQMDVFYDERFLKTIPMRQILSKINNDGVRAHRQKALDGKECPVLLEPLRTGHTFKLPCDHYVSRVAWLRQKGLLCPLCRADSRDGRIEPM